MVGLNCSYIVPLI